MGLFDTVTCHYPVEGYEVPFQFQTKKFECFMDKYSITADGKLVRHTHGMEDVPDEEHPNFNTPEWNSEDKNVRSMARFIGGWRHIKRDEVIEFHGDLWIDDETFLRFTDGVVSRVVKLKDV